ncbi:hypothetical protein [Nocardia harenae]|uniref:hypothetical protein n=1 Tax=Nocardia harenae TaxID=358707 RepID=UPI000832E676|nr:hypothetical protein [Nocardia harenae]
MTETPDGSEIAARRELERAAGVLRAELLGIAAELAPGRPADVTMLPEPAVLEWREPLRYHYRATLLVHGGGTGDLDRAAALLTAAGWKLTRVDDELTAVRAGFRLRLRAHPDGGGLGISGDTPGYVLYERAGAARPEPVVTAATLRTGYLLCYECDGLGWCPECFGRGWILDAEQRRTRCVECRGGRTCPICAGAGQLAIAELNSRDRAQYPELDEGGS